MLDLARAPGQSVLRRLAPEADVIVESYPPGTLARWGLSYARAVVAQSRPHPGVDHPVRAGRSVSGLPHERDRRRSARRPALHHRLAGTRAAQDGRQSRAPQRRRSGLQRHHGGALAARSDGSGAADRPLDPGGDGDHADPREHRGDVAGHGRPADGERAGGGARRLGLDRTRDGRLARDLAPRVRAARPPGPGRRSPLRLWSGEAGPPRRAEGRGARVGARPGQGRRLSPAPRAALDRGLRGHGRRRLSGGASAGARVLPGDRPPGGGPGPLSRAPLPHRRRAVDDGASAIARGAHRGDRGGDRHIRASVRIASSGRGRAGGGGAGLRARWSAHPGPDAGGGRPVRDLSSVQPGRRGDQGRVPPAPGHRARVRCVPRARTR